MKKPNLQWLKIYWSKLVITLCTIFIAAAVSYTVYNYLTPITTEELSTDLSNNKKGISTKETKNTSDTKNSVEPFKLSDEDVDKEVSSNLNNVDDEDSSQNKNTSQKETTEEIIKYEVQSGDTLFSVCRRYMPYVDTTKAITTLKELNDIKDDNLLKTGKILNIPTYDSPEAKNPNITDNVNTLDYTVKPGDTLFGIARNYMTWCDSREGVMEIIKLNKLENASIIKTGQKLIIPCNTNK